MKDNILDKVQRILEKDLPADVTHIISELATEHIRLSKSESGSHNTEEIEPEIDNMIYRAKLSDVDEGLDTSTLESVRNNIQSYLRDAHSTKFLNISSDRASREAIKREIRDYCIRNAVRVDGMTLNDTIEILVKEILDYGILTDLIFDYDRPEDSKIEEIRVYSWDDLRIVIKGTEYRTQHKFESPEQALTIAQKMCRNAEAPMVKPDNPFVRLRMGNSIRVSLMTSPIAREAGNTGQPIIQMTIRKQASKPFDSSFLVNNGTISDYGDQLIDMIMNGLISTAFYGGTNSGKTGTMASYANRLDRETRIISQAEIDEMNLRQIDEITGEALNSVLMWETNPDRGIGFQKMINWALTFTPETLILQESKGPEIVDIIDASITGHQTVLTLHAKNMTTFGKRILGMWKQSGSDLSDDLILDYVVDAFPVIVRMKIYRDGRRRIADIGEIKAYDRTTGKFDIIPLVTFELQDTREALVFDKHLGKKVKKIQITGRHVVNNFISDELKNEMMENGVSRVHIDELEAMYKQELDVQVRNDFEESEVEDIHIV